MADNFPKCSGADWFPKYSGADWLAAQMKYRKTSRHRKLPPLAIRVADILGQVYAGLYHLGNDIHEQDWFSGYYVRVRIHRELATYDGSDLTGLVILCHDQAIRFSVNSCREPFDPDRQDGNEVEAHELVEQVGDFLDEPLMVLGRDCLELMFHQRTHAHGRLWERHPTMEKAIETWRRVMGGAARG